jgi:hypothetical protein
MQFTSYHYQYNYSFLMHLTTHLFCNQFHNFDMVKFAHSIFHYYIFNRFKLSFIAFYFSLKIMRYS